MRQIRNKNTKPEVFVRRLVHGLGYRYRLHVHKLPGRPDIVFTKRKKVIFVHGCFWHHHENCKKSHIPKTREGYWIPKLEKNRQRDQESLAKLAGIGWESLIIWECQLKDIDALIHLIKDFLSGTPCYHK